MPGSIDRGARGAVPIVGGALECLHERGTAPGGVEGTVAGQGLVEHDAEAVDVGAVVEPLGVAVEQGAEVLGRHVIDRPARCGIDGLAVVVERLPGEVEVEEHGHAVGGDQDVGWLDVAVEDAALVGVIEGLGQPGAPPGDGPVMRSAFQGGTAG